MMSITETLLEKGLIDPDKLREAIALQKSEGLRLDRAMPFHRFRGEFFSRFGHRLLPHQGFRTRD